MGSPRDRVSDNAERVKQWAKAARVTAEVAATALNPLAAPVLRQADLLPPQPMTEYSQDIVEERQKDWAHNELALRKQENAAVPVATETTRAGRSRQAASAASTRETRRSRER